jgi:phage terminase large subunit-like protein
MNSDSQSLPFNPSLLLETLIAQEAKLASQQKLSDYVPYQKQRDFHAAGKDYRERLLMAGNQLGKTLAAGMEYAMHATGRYPPAWPGKHYDRPIVGWAAGITGESTRDNVQRILLGRPGSYGTGAIPKDSILDITPARGQPDLQDSIKIRHETGQVSHIALKSYEKGREKWQGETLDMVWFDEEPPLDIYIEGLTRTNSTVGPVFVTFTPLLGMSDVVKRFLLDKVPGTHVTQMTIDDVSHYTSEQRAAIIASYPEYERDARTKGIPQLGSGRVFPIAEEELVCSPFAIPDYWPQLGGLDFGWDHPSAAIRMAWDRDADCLYVTACHRQREQTPAMFSASIRPWAEWLPWAWPHDGLQHDKGSGEQLAAQYRSQGLKMIGQRATFPDGTNGLEAGVAEMLDRMQTGRLKVFSTLGDWWEEMRMYHRKDGLIVKVRDDLMSATRYAMMMRRFGEVQFKAGQQGQRSFSAGGRNDGLGWLGA